MKKSNNNKFRGNPVNSLNYKYDSVSIAGKISGTALDLIKRYKELAKEAQSNGNYVEMEVFRQYAEHYRKIVTEINERKNQLRDNNQNSAANSDENIQQEADISEGNNQSADNGLVETEAAEPVEADKETKVKSSKTLKVNKRKISRGLMVVEVKEDVSANEKNTANQVPDENAEKPKRRVLKRKTANITETVNE